MLTDLILAILHHVLVFAIAGILAAELVLVHPAMSSAQLKLVARLDLFYGIAAGLVVLVGFARVFFSLKGPEFYLQNPVFWAKIGTFAVVGILSIEPTLRFLKWRRLMTADSNFFPSKDDLSSTRRYLKAEVHLFVLIPIFAAVMARGYGL